MSKRTTNEWGDEYERSTYWDKVALLIVILIVAGVAAWWLETRFGANWAAGALGVVAGVVVFAWGGGFAWGIMRATLGSAARFNSDIAGVEMKRQSVHREYARIDVMRSRSELEYDRDVRRAADQRARLLVDAQRQADAPQYRIAGEIERQQQIDGEWQEYD